MNQESIWQEIIAVNPNLRKIKYLNNNLFTGDSIIHLGNLSLDSLLNNDEFRSSLPTMSVSEFLNLINLHLFGNSQINSDIATVRSEYYHLVDGEECKLNQVEVISTYRRFIYTSIMKENLVSGNIPELIGEYRNKMDELSVIETSEVQKRELDSFYSFQDALEKERTIKKDAPSLKRELKSNSGYINSFAVILSIIGLGFTLAAYILIR